LTDESLDKCSIKQKKDRKTNQYRGPAPGSGHRSSARPGTWINQGKTQSKTRRGGDANRRYLRDRMR